jgi:hypothetical protein
LVYSSYQLASGHMRGSSPDPDNPGCFQIILSFYQGLRLQRELNCFSTDG